MNAINLRMLGRFGNQLFQYAFARAYADQNDCELRCDPWVGEYIFDIPKHRVQERFKTVRSELDFVPGEVNIELNGYFQNQRALIYTRSQIRSWLKWNPEAIAPMHHHHDKVAAHLRRGDYFGYGYPVVSQKSYETACDVFGISYSDLVYISEEQGKPFLDDFYRMTRADTLLRANSSFSWWAAVLADQEQQIFSPVVDGLEGGKEHDVPFVRGNYPRFCNLDFVTDLHLEP